VALQQTHAKTAGVLETIAFHSLIEDALRMTIAEMDRHGVQVTKEIEAVPLMSTDRHKVLQILLNLMRNAKDAVKASGTLPRKITVRACSVGTERVRFQLVDNGVGIPKENLARVFSHGFTTKRDGHGFGLHFGALTASQLGGSLSVESAGLGCGATFTLELPLQAKNDFNPRSTQ
jgi:signal transduction histidine kinase